MGKIGEDVEIGTGVRDHAIIGDGAKIVVNTGVTRDAAPGKTILGFPADDHWHTLRLWPVQNQLSGLIKKMKKISS